MSTTIEITLDDRTVAALDSLKSSRGKDRSEAIKGIILEYATVKGAMLNSINSNIQTKVKKGPTWDKYGEYD
jgi:metal-responsive CopG/Arc/MetJ family transcriptional regulator